MIHIRNAAVEDLDRLMEIERATFPAAEMAERETFAWRIGRFGEWFFVAEQDGRVVALACSRPCEKAMVTDALYETGELPGGATLAVLSLETDPAHGRQGVAGALLRHTVERARDCGMEALVLACKDNLIPYYEKFGFRLAGASASEHGGAKWNDMKLVLWGAPEGEVRAEGL